MKTDWAKKRKRWAANPFGLGLLSIASFCYGLAMRARRALYERLGRQPDETVDYETVEAYYRSLA